MGKIVVFVIFVGFCIKIDVIKVLEYIFVYFVLNLNWLYINRLNKIELRWFLFGREVVIFIY